MNPGDPTQKKSEEKQAPGHSEEYAPYPKLDTSDIADLNPSSSQQQHGGNWGTFVMGSDVPPSKTVTWNPELPKEGPPNAYGSVPATTLPSESNPYVAPSPASAPYGKNTVDTVKDVLGKWGKRVGEATKKAEDLAGNVWQHLKTSPNLADAAMGRITQGTKVIAEGGYEKIFQQAFETLPGEKFQKSYVCYLSTSAGPVMGILYLSTAKLAFCSDNPLSYKVGDQTEWSYYKVIVPLHQLKSVTPSASKVNPAEKFIQVTSVDNHEFWFMGFVNYDSAVKHLQDAVMGSHASQSSV